MKTVDLIRGETFHGRKGAVANAFRYTVDYLLLDNMSLEELRMAVGLRGDQADPRLEASGGVNLQTIAAKAASGVDYISVGRLTQSAPAADIGLDFKPV